MITTWFGVFLFKSTTLVDYKLHPKKKKELMERLHQIQQGNILSEEKELAKGKEILVFESRLLPLGAIEKDKKIDITKLLPKPEDYGFSQKFYQEIMSTLSNATTEEQLSQPDLQIVQMINALDDLIVIANMLKERLDNWSILPETSAQLQPLATTLSTVQQQQEHLQHDIESTMQTLAPNLTSLLGSMIGARLIAQAGSVHRLATFPASTLQILGAEKAFFRYKKEGGKPPKHGILYQHQTVHKAPKHVRGKRARQLALIASTAIKADVFTKRDITDYLQEQLNNMKKA